MINYDHIWSSNKIIDHKVWPTWGLMKDLFANGGVFLEIGAGNRPRIPVEGSHFVDASPEAVKNINKLGAKAQVADAEYLPFATDSFDVVCAFEIMEHVENDKKALGEVLRILRNDGKFIFSVPLGMKYWSPWDELAGHYRRYEPKELKNTLQSLGFWIEKFVLGKNITVLQRYFWLGKIGTAVYRHFPKPFIFVEHHLVTSVVKLETKFGAFDGLKWKQGDFAADGENKTSAILLCSKDRSEALI